MTSNDYHFICPAIVASVMTNGFEPKSRAYTY